MPTRTAAPYAVLLTLLLVGALSTTRLLADDATDPAADSPATTADPAGDEEVESMLELVTKSGVTGWIFLGLLGIASLFAATVAIERAFGTRASVLVPESFVAELKALLARGDATPAELRSLAKSTDSPLAAVLTAGLLRAGRPPVEAEKAMEDAAAREMSDIRSRIRPLGVIGSIAPLIGLLGTVLGMIVAFRTASQAGLGKGELMAQGIYLALLTTAAGLSIAIPCLVLSAFYHSKVERLFREIDVHLMDTLPTFARFEREDVDELLEGGRSSAVEKSPEEHRALATAKG